MTVRLQASVAMTFAVLTALVIGVTTGLFFWNNRNLAIETARVEMAEAQARTGAALDAVILPVVRTVQTMARLVETFPDEIQASAGMRLAEAEMAGLPHVYGVYVAVAATGEFFQAARLVPGQAVFGHEAAPVPAGAATVRRAIRGGLAQIAFVGADGRVSATSLRQSDFDPRGRVWFQRAAAADGAVISPVYQFSSTQEPGVTFSQAVRGPGGAALAVVGADMSLEAVSAILRDIRVDGVGETFLLDQNRNVVAASETQAAGGEPALTAMAVAAWDGTDNAFFRMQSTATQGGHLVAIARLPPMLGTHPYLGVIVPTRHYTGAIADTTLRVIALALAVGLVALAATVVLARLLSGSLGRVSAEARRISAFDLAGEFAMQSRISEVADLGAAVGNMKNSLRSFAAYVPQGVVRAIVASGGRVAVGGTAREVTLLFSDIQGFTSRSEGLPPEVAMRDLSRYFQAMSAAVVAQGGTVDKYIGDAVMAIWNAPGDVPDHAAAACRGALACVRAEAALNAAAGPGGIFPTRTRIGLHRDRVVVGNVGSADRLQYTAIGGAVNLASRVEGLNKVYGTQLLATQAVVDAAGPGFLFREVDRVSPAGTTRPVVLHELLGLASEDDQDRRRDMANWNAALAAFRRRDWGAAEAGFASLRAGAVNDRLRALYLQRCAQAAAVPPPDDWNAVTVLKEK